MRQNTSPSEIDRLKGPAGRPIPRERDALLNEAEVASLLGISKATLQAMRSRPTGDAIPFVKLNRSIRYSRGAVDDFVQARERLSTRG